MFETIKFTHTDSARRLKFGRACKDFWRREIETKLRESISLFNKPNLVTYRMCGTFSTAGWRNIKGLNYLGGVLGERGAFRLGIVQKRMLISQK